MYLSKLTLLPGTPAFLDNRNLMHEHRFIMSLFPALKEPSVSPRSELEILWRFEERRNYNSFVLIKSKEKPEISNIVNDRIHKSLTLETKEYPVDSIKKLKEVSYSVRVNTVKRVESKTIALKTDDEITSWWVRKASEAGLDITNKPLTIEKENSLVLQKKVNQASTNLTGRASIKDVEALLAAMNNGIGRAKNYGFGLLLLGS